jgi:hypothetical protein
MVSDRESGHIRAASEISLSGVFQSNPKGMSPAQNQKPIPPAVSKPKGVSFSALFYSLLATGYSLSSRSLTTGLPGFLTTNHYPLTTASTPPPPRAPPPPPPP